MTPMNTEKQLASLRFQTDTSMRYHEYRRAYFERRERIIAFLNVLLSSGVAAAASHSDIVVATGVAVFMAFLNAYVTAFKPSEMARHHVKQQTRYSDLDIDLRGLTAQPDIGDLAEFEKRMALVERDELPLFNYVWAESYNDAARWASAASKYGQLTWRQRAVRHLTRGNPAAVSRPDGAPV